MLQISPAIRIGVGEYIGLAEKALLSLGMAPAVWLLVQLHQTGAITFYKLPSPSITTTSTVAGQSGEAPSAHLGASPTASKTTLPTLDSGSSEACKLAGLLGQAATKEALGQSWDSPNKEAGRAEPFSTVTLNGLSVDIAIVVVLSWAAQLVQIRVALEFMENDDITFVLGESGLPRLLYAQVAIAMHCLRTLSVCP